MRFNKPYFLFLFLTLTLVLSNCQTEEKSPAENDQKLAQVFNKVLYLSDLDGMVSRTIHSYNAGLSWSRDSTQFAFMSNGGTFTRLIP